MSSGCLFGYLQRDSSPPYQPLAAKLIKLSQQHPSFARNAKNQARPSFLSSQLKRIKSITFIQLGAGQAATPLPFFIPLLHYSTSPTLHLLIYLSNGVKCCQVESSGVKLCKPLK